MEVLGMDASAKKQDFVGYEYKSVVAPHGLASLYIDCYPCFGWEIEGRTSDSFGSRMALAFRRNRKMKNKVEVNKLQHQFEQGIETIEHLEKSKTMRASIVAYAVGLLGTAFLAGATFSFLAGQIIICIVSAVPGFLGWGIAYLLYRRIYAKQSAKASVEIERALDGMYATCEKANTLLA